MKKYLDVGQVVSQVLAAACITSAPSIAHAGDWSTAAGVDYQTGDYGQAADTTIWQVPFTVSYSEPRWSASLTVPYVHLKGTGAIIPSAVGFGAGPSSTTSSTTSVTTTTGGVSGAASAGGVGVTAGVLGGTLGGVLGGAPTGSTTVGTTTTTTPGSSATPTPAAPTVFTAEGIGDVVAQLAVAPYVGANGTRFTIVGAARLPSGDEKKALGAGETVGSIAGVLAVPLAQRASITGSLGYSRAFDSETDGWFAGLGVQAYVAPRVQLGGGLDWSQASVPGAEDRSDASVSAAFDMSERSRLLVYASTGLTDQSPDFGAGVGLSVRY